MENDWKTLIKKPMFWVAISSMLAVIILAGYIIRTSGHFMTGL